jgi:hypothetical protein
MIRGDDLPRGPDPEGLEWSGAQPGRRAAAAQHFSRDAKNHAPAVGAGPLHGLEPDGCLPALAHILISTS